MVPTTQDRIDHAKRTVARCLTPQERKKFYLPPEPPAWCIEMEKWPYHTIFWKTKMLRKAIRLAVKANQYEKAVKLQTEIAQLVEKAEIKKTGKAGAKTARNLAGLAWYALFARDFEKTRESYGTSCFAGAGEIMDQEQPGARADVS